MSRRFMKEQSQDQEAFAGLLTKSAENYIKSIPPVPQRRATYPRTVEGGSRLHPKYQHTQLPDLKPGDKGYMNRGMMMEMGYKALKENIGSKRGFFSSLKGSPHTSLGVLRPEGPTPEATAYMNYMKDNQGKTPFMQQIDRAKSIIPFKAITEPSVAKQSMSLPTNNMVKNYLNYIKNNPETMTSSNRPTIDYRVIGGNLQDMPYDSDISRDLTLRSAGKRGSF